MQAHGAAYAAFSVTHAGCSSPRSSPSGWSPSARVAVMPWHSSSWWWERRRVHRAR